MVAEKVFGLALTIVCETTVLEFLLSLKLHGIQYVMAITGEPAFLPINQYNYLLSKYDH